MRGKPRIRVNVYIRDQQYGGPEEGGWYYETKTPFLSMLLTDEHDRYSEENLRQEAEEIAIALRAKYGDKGNRYRVMSGEDDYEVKVEKCKPRYWPRHRPRYE